MLKWLPILLLLPLVGCGRSYYTVPVSGLVTYNGKPVADAAVMFQPVNGGPPVSGSTDSSGRYIAKTNNILGIAPGSYKVAISKQTYSQTASKAPNVEEIGGGYYATYHIPKTYANANDSGLTAQIEGPREDLNFELK